MISYLRGEAIDLLKNPNNRSILILEVNHIGYEIQIPSGLSRVITTGENYQIFTHFQVKEDQQILYGFESASERDLFRQLLGVNGVGAQSALALIDTHGGESLVGAIVTSNIGVLIKTPGVGGKTAERIVLELKTKLAQWRDIQGLESTDIATSVNKELVQEVQMTLLALGYTNGEIEKALSIISKDNQILKSNNVEDWIKGAITFLS
ncbi:MAG: Holliday junction ATP-dependent DNA helicase RuvA [Chroococcopsis gigantea SAG 12.99]|jgi:Holliday junction DNA helicase RuvA|nr:Holliday junction ATP-dependent DNA helicase RuvA [Chroococcopsis gigantea SAG 12.99]